jgi:hypothetical protein
MHLRGLEDEYHNAVDIVEAELAAILHHDEMVAKLCSYLRHDRLIYTRRFECERGILEGANHRASHHPTQTATSCFSSVVALS